MADSISATEASFTSTDFTEDRGMYGDGEDSYLEEMDDIDFQALENQVYKNVYDKAYADSTTEINPFVSTTKDGKKLNILGLPMNFCKTADPNGRVYRDTILEQMPYVFFMPGKGVLNRKLIDSSGSVIKKMSMLTGLESLSDSAKFGVKGIRSGEDLRFVGFRAYYKEYYKYVQVLCNSVYNTMGFSGNFYYKDEYENQLRSYGLCFYADNSTSISESASNDYSQSSIVQKTNDLSAQVREFKTLMGVSQDGIISKGLGLLSAAVTTVAEITDITGIFARAGQVFGRVVNGSQLLYPDIWSDSTFERSYNMQFKFYSPYGDKLSIFKYVYVPFLSMLAFSLPIQDSIMGYGQPFCLRICQPGWFDSSMAVVTSIDFVKGGQDNCWTIDGLPQEITVSVSIKDLYPTIPITKKYGNLVYNLGLSSFLDTMAGVRTDQLKLTLALKRLVSTRISVPVSFMDSLGNKLSDFGYELQNKINNMLR